MTTLKPGNEVYAMPWFPRAADAYAKYVTPPTRQFARTRGKVVLRVTP